LSQNISPRYFLLLQKLQLVALAILLRCNTDDFFKAARGIVGGCKAKDGSNFGNWLIGSEQHGFKTADSI
jgi:hypothetical protein